MGKNDKEGKKKEKKDKDEDKEEKKKNESNRNLNEDLERMVNEEKNPKKPEKKASKKNKMKKKKSEHPEKDKQMSTNKLQEGKIEEVDDEFDYDEDRIPPDWTICEQHYLSRISAPERNDDELNVKNTNCKCCGYAIEREPLPLTCDFRKLGFLGVGYPLFFSYIISAIYVLLIIFCVSGIFNLASNNRGEDCYTQSEIDVLVLAAKFVNNTAEIDYLQNKECVLAWATRLSIGNKRDNEANLTAQRWLNFVTILILIVYFQIMRKNQRKIDKDCDESLTTPADFTVMVTNIKTGLPIDYDDEIKEFFEGYAIPGQKANIVSVNLGYNMKSKIELQKQQDKLIKTKQRALAYKNKNGSFPSNYNESSTNDQIQAYEKLMDGIEKEFISGKTDKFCGIAFVTFLTEDEKNACLNKHYKTLRERVFLYFIDTFKKALIKPEKADFFFHDQRIYIFEAPEPTDVYWENLHFSNFELYIRRILADVFNFMILVGFGVGIYYLNYYQALVQDENKEAASLSTSEEIKIKVIGAIISVSISLVIEILKVLIPIISNFEKRKTRTDYFTSVAFKLSIASFCTSSLITFLITVTYFENYFGSSGLINNQMIVFITNLIIPVFIQTLNIPYIIRIIQRKIARSKGENSTLTQKQANELYQDPVFLIEKAYAQIGFTMIFTGFYAAILPLGLLFSMGTLILLYWVYKYNVMRKSTVLYDIDSNLSYAMTDVLELTALSFAASEFIFTRIIFGEYPVPSILCLAVAGFNWWLPTEIINEKIFKFQVQSETKNYFEAEDDFDTDYARENPGTSDIARELFERKEADKNKDNIQKNK